MKKKKKTIIHENRTFDIKKEKKGKKINNMETTIM